jgi:hypothetical protein
MIADLSSIDGLNAKRLAVLTDTLSIRTPGDLARADRRAIHAAMRAQGLRPTLEEISIWQDDARDMATASDPGWEQVAAFVVSFEQRQTDAGPQRRVAAEQAEREPPVPREVWPDWQDTAVSDWMLHQLPAEQAEHADAPEATNRTGPSGQAVPPAGPPDQTPTPATGPHGTSRPALTIADAVMLIPGTAPLRLISAGDDVADVPSGTRLKVIVFGAAAGQQILIALRVRRPGRPTLTVPAVASTTVNEPVEIDLSAVPPGTHAAALAAWTESGSAAPVVHTLPRLRIEET